ncbi:MAG: hypothetical protein HONBIEJF_00129 [Fimbriimonadaceae bacterium]|nr:hypothetical protein [Fimbriimonadaceae bacterium]
MLALGIAMAMLTTPTPPGQEVVLQNEPKKLVLIPLDDRPAATQFAQMIGEIADVEVVTPPTPMLGKFLQAGKPDAILDWLESQKPSELLAIVVNTDMLTCGGLIASRLPDTPYRTAIDRLRRFWKIRKNFSQVPVFAYSAIMRLAPTATKASTPWRMKLAKYIDLRFRYSLNRDPVAKGLMESVMKSIPPQEILRYDQARKRNHDVQKEVVRMTKAGVFDYLILGQDDAQPSGPHIRETKRLKEMVHNLMIPARVYFCEGIDQHANVLVSRVMLKRSGWTPRVRVVFSDEDGKKKIANYETENVETSLEDQLLASGARPARSDTDYDYTLYVNTPEPRYDRFDRFLNALKFDIDQGFPVAIADINLGKSGKGDTRLFQALLENARTFRLLSYAGWNTAGNSMGTAIPAANLYLLARRLGTAPLQCELSQRAFILHRIIDDFAFHHFTRPQAYGMIDTNPQACREETYGEHFESVDQFVRDDLTRRLVETFREQYLGRRFFAGSRAYVFSGLEAIDVRLPWPRAYEVALNFKLQVEAVQE